VLQGDYAPAPDNVTATLRHLLAAHAGPLRALLACPTLPF